MAPAAASVLPSSLSYEHVTSMAVPMHDTSGCSDVCFILSEGRDPFCVTGSGVDLKDACQTKKSRLSLLFKGKVDGMVICQAHANMQQSICV